MGKHDLDSELIRKLAGLLDETGLTELEYATQAVRIRVARNAAPTGFFAGPAPMAAPAANAPAVAAVVPAARAADHPGVMTSPMVGTVYVSPEPGAAPFVKVGDTVRQGQTLLIVEAMKVMNPLVAPKAGKITEILVQDNTPVEFGEPLLVIE